jgi:hypothetical protein
MTDARAIADKLTEAQRRVLSSRKAPNDYRAGDALALQRLGVLCFTPMGDVVSTPLGLAVRDLIAAEEPKT